MAIRSIMDMEEPTEEFRIAFVNLHGGSSGTEQYTTTGPVFRTYSLAVKEAEDRVKSTGTSYLVLQCVATVKPRREATVEDKR